MSDRDGYKGEQREPLSDSRAEQPAVVPTERARQGATGQNVRYVLTFGLVAIIVAFAVIYIVFFA